MGKMEIITRTERKRRWTETEKRQILAECQVKGVTIKSVAKRHDMAESVIYRWRTEARSRENREDPSRNFILYGEVADKDGSGSGKTLMPQVAQPLQSDPATVGSGAPLQSRRSSVDHDLVQSLPGNRPGTIDIILTSGERLIVDSFVNERALHRVLRTLRGRP